MSSCGDLLLCDLAETYGIYDMYQYRPFYIGALVAGLRDDSRVKMYLSGARVSSDRIIAAYTADRIANLVWMLSKDGQDGFNPPKSMLAVLLGTDEPAHGYDTPEEFDEAMKKYEVHDG
jgi:hypothetical protein